MTEAEWETSTDVTELLNQLGAWKDARKSRMFAVACCLRIYNLLTRPGVKAIEAAEFFAEGRITREVMHGAWRAVGFPKNEPRQFAAAAARGASCSPGYDGTAHSAASAVNAAVTQSRPTERDVTRQSVLSTQANLLRCIFGNPFRPVALDPSWRTEAVVGLADGIYADCAFDRLPVLADALEDAGCANTDVLAHCRSPGPHARGCWVVDLLLGKA